MEALCLAAEGHERQRMTNEERLVLLLAAVVVQGGGKLTVNRPVLAAVEECCGQVTWACANGESDVTIEFDWLLNS